jgi:hypothetical protein
LLLAVHRPAIIPAAPEHIPHIAANVRPDDRRELELLGWAPDQALRLSLRSALVAWTGTVDDAPICMFGVSPGELGEGRPWMIGAADLDRFAVIFLRRCRGQVERMLELRPVLANYISVENIRAIQWLTWLGFSMEVPVPWGRSRQPFYRFELRR